MEGVPISERIERRFPLWYQVQRAVVSLCLLVAAPALAAEPIAVFPTGSYDAFLVYESLAVFWLAIIGLVVIIRMKLREIERTQALGADQEDKDAPLLQ